MAKVKNTKDPGRRTRNILTGIVIAMLFVNVLVLARASEIIRFPGETSDATLLREGANALIEYYDSQAAKLGLDKNTAVRGVLANFGFEVSKATTESDLAYNIGYYGRLTSDTLNREYDNKRRETLLGIINNDKDIVSKSKEQQIINVYVTAENRIEVDDPGKVLDVQTIENIKSTMESMEMNTSLDVEIYNGKASIITSRSMQDRVKLLQDELDSVRLSLEDLKRTSGYSVLTGHGINIKVYDSRDGFADNDVVQDTDIRDMVNELFAAGAQGVEVGGERITATSSIRSAGPEILVNQRSIAVNPVIIKAIGDSEVLESSLDLIKNGLRNWGIIVNVEKIDNVSLSAYRAK